MPFALAVVPLEIEPTRIAEVATNEEEEMQVLVDGRWHRDVISGASPSSFRTACGLTYHSQFTGRRRSEYRGPLCPNCFTTFELALVPSEIDP